MDVLTKQGAKADHQIVLSLHCGGESVLWLEDDDYLPEAGEAPMRQRLTMEEFEALVAEQMVVAPQLLKLNYQSFKKSGREQMRSDAHSASGSAPVHCGYFCA